ncbi:MAG: benzoate-CoA ligase family protein [Acidobacteria bacterium]|nr:benzoate-CoA ligase family protein [Acidobacteriota bacterium]
MLPPREDWPDLISLSELNYPEKLNVCFELLDRNVLEGRGKNPAVHYGTRTMTYAELLEQVKRFSCALVRQGMKHGDRVLIRSTNTPEFVVAWLSILRIGAIAVATMPLLRARELKEMLRDSGANLAVCGAALLEELDKTLAEFPQVQVVVCGGTPGRHHSFEGWVNGPALSEPCATRSDDIALLAYTSGSTGIPKGTIHFHRDVLAIADTYSRHILNPSASDVFSGHPTLAFTFGLGGLLVFPFRVGASVAYVDKFTPEIMLRAVRDHGVTILFAAPTSYKMMMRDFGKGLNQYLPKLRLCVSAGETLPAAVFTEWKQQTGITILDGIGSTEMLHIFISNSVDDARPGFTGKPVFGYEARVVDSELREVPAGQEGMLAVRGPTGCRYWNRPERQKEYVKGGWNFPGDIFFRDKEGYFHYGCRSDDLIICGGVNISGPEVENVLIQHPAVKEAAVVASPDDLKGFVPKAFVVLNESYLPESDLSEDLKDFVKKEIAPYKYPRRVEFVSELPKTATGKIRRVELRARELGKA